MNNKKLAIFANSNNYSDFHHMLSIIMAAISNEMEINVFFSYGALDKLIKIKNNNINFNSNNKIENYFHKALRKKNIQSDIEIFKMIKETGLVKIFACSSSVTIMNIKEDDLLNVDKIMGLTTFLGIVEKSDTVLYI